MRLCLDSKHCIEINDGNIIKILKIAKNAFVYTFLCFDPTISLKEINIMFYNLYTFLCSTKAALCWIYNSAPAYILIWISLSTKMHKAAPNHSFMLAHFVELATFPMTTNNDNLFIITFCPFLPYHYFQVFCIYMTKVINNYTQTYYPFTGTKIFHWICHFRELK